MRPCLIIEVYQAVFLKPFSCPLCLELNVQQDYGLMQFGMEDGDTIEVQQHQIGGCGSASLQITVRA